MTVSTRGVVLGIAALGAAAIAAVAIAGFGERWPPVTDPDLTVAAGSPLDVSAYMDPSPAGAHGRIVADRDGHLATADGRRARLFAASIVFTPASGGYPDHATADAYADQLRRHGYNAVRIHYADLDLMSGRTGDLNFDPDQLDRFRYFLAAVKKRGLYWVIDAMTSPNGGIGTPGLDRWAEPGADLSLRVFTDPAARAQWLALTRAMLGTTNPYTGAAPLADPALALVVLANENDINMLLDKRRATLGGAYPAALTAGLARSGAAAAKLTDQGPRQDAVQAHLIDLERSTFDWMAQAIRGAGYPGLTTMFDSTERLADHRVHDVLPVVDTHVYFDLVKPAVGQSMSQRDPLATGGPFAQNAAFTRWYGKPFTVTEYAIPYWNMFRHSSGLVMGAVGALQDWDLICERANGPVELSYRQTAFRKRTLYPYNSTGLDPIGRASETLAWFLFYRGDVSPSASSVAFDVSGTQGSRAHLADDMLRLALVERVGLSEGRARADATISPPVGDGSYPAVPVFAREIARLRATGAMAAANATDIDAGRFESTTGQIRIDTRSTTMRVVTPRTEAAAFQTPGGGLALGHLTVNAADGPALIAVSTLDARPIAASQRMLVTLASDALASGVQFADPGHHLIRDFGTLPVTVRPAHASLALAGLGGGHWRLRALRLNGTPAAAVPVRMAGGAVTFDLDTVQPFGPTTFWLLERIS